MKFVVLKKPKILRVFIDGRRTSVPTNHGELVSQYDSPVRHCAPIKAAAMIILINEIRLY
jgi:hypothetical protein